MLILVAIAIGIGLFLIVFLWGSVKWTKYSKGKEQIRYQKEVCDTIKTTTGPLQISISGFTEKELKKVHFYLREGEILKKDTLVKVNFNAEYNAQEVELPFKSFHVNNRVIVKVANKFFILSGIKYYAYYNYGMFGPVGSCQCGMGSFETINGKPAGSGWLIKKYGLLTDQLP